VNKNRRYTEEEKLFLGEAIKKGRRLSEATEMFNEHFSPPATKGMLQDLCERLGLRCVYQNMPQPVGSERVRQGRVYVKTVGGKWVGKHVLIWEGANGKVPQGHAVIFADGNKRNMALDNLLLVSKAELRFMNRKRLISACPDMTRLGHAMAGMRIAAKKAVTEKTGAKNVWHFMQPGRDQ